MQFPAERSGIPAPPDAQFEPGRFPMPPGSRRNAAATRAPGAHRLLRTLPMPRRRAAERPGRAFAQAGFRYYEDPEPAGRSRLAASERRMRTRSVLRPRAHIGLAARR